MATDYTYWNAGLTLGFMENWSADIRYWDTDGDAIQEGPFQLATLGLWEPFRPRSRA